MEKFSKENEKILYDKKKKILPEEKNMEDLKKVDGGTAVNVDLNSTVETHNENNSKVLNANDIGGNVSF